MGRGSLKMPEWLCENFMQSFSTLRNNIFITEDPWGGGIGNKNFSGDGDRGQWGIKNTPNSMLLNVKLSKNKING